jgi:PPP family 3-phenylpropionic acid transporter
MSPPAIDGRERRGLAARLAFLFGALFLIYGVSMPYLPVWLDWRGLSTAEIAIIGASPAFIRLFLTPGLAFLADALGGHRHMLIALAWTGLAAALTLAHLSGFWAILAVSVLLSIAASTVMPLSDTVAMSGVRAAGLDYGRMRLWGSVTFIAASAGGGLALDRWGAGAVAWLLALATGLMVVAAHALPPPKGFGRLAAATTGPRLRLADALRLVASAPFVLFVATATLAQASHAMMYAFGTLHWRAQSVAPGVIGLLWATGVVAEICLFAVSRAVTSRIGPVLLLVIGAAGGLVRWLAMAFDPPVAALVPLQCLHALSFGAAHLGAIHFIARAVRETGAGTAQAVLATAIGTAIGLATLLSGYLFERHAGGTYLAMAAFAAAAVVCGSALLARWDGRMIGCND